MTTHSARYKRFHRLTMLGCLMIMAGCIPPPPEPPPTIALDPVVAAQQADSILQQSAIQIADGLRLSLWAVDELAPDPIALAFDEQGRAYTTRTNRQKNSEFDIRGYRHWMTRSIGLQTVEDRRDFLHDVFAPERSDENTWLADLNGDSLHDWRDLAVEKEQVYRVEDTSGDGVADRSILFLEDFNTEVTDIAGGVLPFEDDVFLALAPDLWRLTDTDGNGTADEKVSLSHGYAVHIGFSGHNMSGLTVGPDGRIYWSIGDIGFNVVDPTGKRWAYPNQGAVLRANPDGSDFEVFAAGLRNTHEIVFDAYGNLISVDNDGDHPGEMERIVYIVNGSDSGWRINWQFGKYYDPDNNTYKVWMDEEMFKPRFEGQAAYITPPIANYHAGPAGMAYNPGTALGEAWRDRFFVAEFVGSPAGSNIYAFKLQPKGASFEFVDEEVVSNGILATGLDFGPDGALYVADWIEGWGTKNRGRIWKLDLPGEATSAMRREVQTLIGEDFGDHPARRLLELLQHADMRVRQKAQFELAKRGEEGAETLLAAARQTDHQLARLHGLWGLSQLYRKEVDVGEDLASFLQDADPEIRAQAAKMIGDVRYANAADALVPLLQDDTPRARFFAAEALGRIAYKPAVQPIIDMLEANDDADAYLRHAGALALARIGEADPVIALADHPSRAVRIAAVVALRRLKHPEVARFLEDDDAFIVTEAARAINDDFSIEEALPALAQVLGNPRFTNEALMRRAINANHRLGTAEAANRVGAYAARPDVLEALAVEALASLGVWSKPSLHDRVDGRYRDLGTRNPAIAEAAVARVIEPLLMHGSPAVKVAAAATAGRLDYDAVAPTLARLVRQDRTPEVRAAALQALYATGYNTLDEVIEEALADADAEVRMTALTFVPELNLSDDRTATLLGSVLGRTTMQEQQAALQTLGSLQTTEANAVLAAQLDQLIAGTLRPEIQLDVMEAVDASGSAPLVARLEQYRNARPEDNLMAVYREALEGGDPDIGAQIFFRHESAQCVRCHAVGDYGGGVGPNLLDIGSVLSREQLLESLIDPSARIAPGYGIETFTLNAGQTVSGTVQQETASHLILRVEEEDRRIDKAEIAQRQRAPSSMPPMGSVLTRRQLRDVVAFLADQE